MVSYLLLIVNFKQIKCKFQINFIAIRKNLDKICKQCNLHNLAFTGVLTEIQN
jgi:hypothetical protein